MRPRLALIPVVPFAFVVLLASACSRAEAPATETASTPPPVENARPAGGRLFVTNEVSGDITVIDVAAQKVLTTIPVGQATARHSGQP